MKIRIKLIISIILLNIFTISCTDYLNIVPDNTPTIEHAFNKRYQAESYLYGCYSFLPNFSLPNSNFVFFGADEAWLSETLAEFVGNIYNIWTIARGEQGTNTPIANYWASSGSQDLLYGGKPLFTGIRDCNIFLENIYTTPDIEDWERDQWISEAKFLKAYFHFWLFRMYGPIPIIDENIPVSADIEEVRLFRQPVDSVANYIVKLLDEASEGLPLKITDITNDLGRATKPIALAVKAQVLVLAASPLFNGNTDYIGYTDNQGTKLFPQQYELGKWEKAVKALKEAIEVCHDAGHELYDFSMSNITANLQEQTILAMQVRGAVTERWNSEIIWGDSNNNTQQIQRTAFPVFSDYQNGGAGWFCYAPTLRVIEQFYTKNGIPITEDKEWGNVNLYGLNKGDAEHKNYIKEGFETINLHFNREPRFYGAISFDGGTFYGNGELSDKNMQITQFKHSSIGRFTERHSATGYLVKKVIHRLTSITGTSTNPNYYRYTFPIIRLADLYLLYAEALNELKDIPDGEVYEYIDKVRNRTGLNGVVESWQAYSTLPNKPLTKEGMREIIQRERLNELAFEGARFWDLRRWKLAEVYMSEPIMGLNKYGKNASDFYQRTELYSPVFDLKDYLWPIGQNDLIKNRNLTQNPGW